MTSPFAHPWLESFTAILPLPRSKDEWLIVDISNSIREKPQWKSQYKDESIASQWKQEIKDCYSDKTQLIDEIIDYVFAELEWYDNVESEYPGFTIACDDKIVFSDTAIDPDLKLRLSSELKNLQSSFGDKPDYHPHTGNKVVDLIHPSLFPLEYSATPTYADAKKSVVQLHEYSDEIHKVKKWVGKYGTSHKFQWLPSLLRINHETDTFEFKSYINNLHPTKYASLYKDIQAVFNAVVPGLNFCLSRYASKPYFRIDIPPFEEAYEEEFQEKFKEFIDSDEPWKGEKFWELMNSKVNYLKSFHPKYVEGPDTNKTIDLVQDFHRLKVIVKASNIELTPDNPRYEGGKWHVDGTINEDIVASVMYYYDVENITESNLKFKACFGDPKYEQGDDTYPREIYGVKDGDVMTRELGSITAHEGRIVISPNCFQHQVAPFELKNKSKPGHRKLLCFYLVDPYNHVVVTTDQVPPQQKAWWDDNELKKNLADSLRKKILDLKPDEEFPVSWERAQEVREELMKDRNKDLDEFDEDPAFTRKFSFWNYDSSAEETAE
ncbi:predicted protein [Scheffersomyces stipitis CBS 6054]|uniref:Uncharacterized protein n=1 Tax=Scheffersomyces stipitis (strain ATCC 58785 / CBS 6054 / NBRC 10063 / NRRL Y-11545) TaxID=322104 RepID=A3LXF8_PICST|nr:predicted protein [Scheffersomyces stipitis CBS 6054]ABN67801.2 predicted protein [Scheffersomyces stipitis CBS 6054]